MFSLWLIKKQYNLFPSFFIKNICIYKLIQNKFRQPSTDGGTAPFTTLNALHIHIPPDDRLNVKSCDQSEATNRRPPSYRGLLACVLANPTKLLFIPNKKQTTKPRLNNFCLENGLNTQPRKCGLICFAYYSVRTR